jgi:hypothetical protein
MSAAADATPLTTRRRLAILVLFATAMGWLEAVVVVYIRGLLGIARHDTIPAAGEVMRRLAALPWLLPTEQTREAATLLMLATVAVLSATTFRSRFGAFLVLFGTWDIVYYVGLYALLRWPPSLMTMDLLFLLPPHPWWYQPVWVPVLVSCVMIGLGLRLYLRAPRSGRLSRPM